LKLLTENDQDYSIFEETWIIVPNHAAKQWLQKSLANDLGVCAQIRFIMPLSFNWEILKNVVKEDQKINYFSTDVLRWQIFGLINNNSSYQHLKQNSDIKNFNLSEKIAQTLIKYNDEHPETINSWDSGVYKVSQDQEWQVELWLHLLEKLKIQSPVQLLQKFDATKDFKQSPRQIIFFSTEQLTTFQKDTLLKLAQDQEINIMITNPCPQDYWFDIKSNASKARTELLNGQVADVIDVGNPILANLGYNKMAIFDALLNNEVNLNDGQTEIQGNSLLQSLKKDIFNLNELPSINSNDDSISIHSCYTRQREIELVKDIILTNLDTDKSLNPENIIVIAPDINEYVQSINAVFSCSENNRAYTTFLPFHIDRVQMADANYITALMKLLKSFSNEMSASVIYELLTQNVILQKFKIDQSDLPRIKNWIIDSNIRNYFSAKDKATKGYEEKIGNTWQFGKNRWLTGYLTGTLTGDQVNTQYLSTYGAIAGQEEMFSQCFDFLDLWNKCYEFAQQDHTPEKWYIFIQEVCRNILYNDYSDDYETKVIKQLENKFITQTLNSQEEIPLVIIVNIIEAVITENTFRSEGQIGVRFQTWENAFVSDSKLLIIMGLNENEFPKKLIKNDLDIFSKTPAKLNKSTRQRDKNLMLTALTENMDKLILTYVGFDAKTNEVQPPSVILAEIITYLETKTNKAFKVKTHKMHGYNQAYYSSNPDYLSYNHKNYQLAQSFYDKNRNSKKMATQGNTIAINLEHENNINLNDLCRFFTDPLDFFLKKRAQISHSIYESTLQDTETYFPTGLETWQLKNEVFNNGVTTAAKTGIVSDNKSGQAIISKYNNALHDLHTYNKSLDLKIHAIDLVAGKFKIFGNIQIDNNQHLVSVYPNLIKAKSLCHHWIKHLCYSSDKPSYAHFEDKTVMFSPQENYQTLLLDILQKWDDSYSQPWLFCPNKIINAKLKKPNVMNRDAYLKQFVETDNTYPSEGQKYFFNQVIEYDEQIDREEFIRPLIENIENFEKSI
jgi:exodeoxyribonuclease V gamma subunit